MGKMTGLKCAYCNEIFQYSWAVGVTTHKGKLYHTSCYNTLRADDQKDDYDTLCRRFPEIHSMAINALLDTNGFEETMKGLKHNWCVITEGLNEDVTDGIDMDVFDTKKKMLDWLSDKIYHTIKEDWGWAVLFILKKGNTKCVGDAFNIKVSLLK